MRQFVVGEAVFPQYGLSASCVGCDEVACVDDHARAGLLEHSLLPIGQAPHLRGEDVLAVSRFAVGPSSMGDTAGRQGPRHLIHHGVVEGTVLGLVLTMLEASPTSRRLPGKCHQPAEVRAPTAGMRWESGLRLSC